MRLTKILSVLMLVSSAATAMAAEDTTVLNDTRQYEEFTSSISGLRGCHMPTDLDNVKPGECVVTKSRYIKTGELLTRSRSNGVCLRTTWRELGHTVLAQEGQNATAPSWPTLEERYACGADGTPVSNP